MLTLPGLIAREDEILAESTAFDIRGEGNQTDIQKTSSLTRLLRSTDKIFLIPGAISDLENLRDIIKDLANNQKKESRKRGNRKSDSYLANCAYQRRVSKAIKSLINAFKNKTIDPNKSPEYQTFEEIVFYLEKTLDIRRKYARTRDASPKLPEQMTAAALCKLIYNPKGIAVITTKEGYLKALLEDVQSVLEQPDFELENQRIVKGLRKRGIRLYKMDMKRGNYELIHNSAAFDTKGTINLETQTGIDFVKEKLLSIPF